MAYDKYILVKSGAMTDSITLWTEFPANWRYFFNETVMTPDSPGEVSKIVDVKAHSVRRGPGDTAPYTRRASQRFHVRYPKSKGAARPGYTIQVAEPAVLGGGYREKRQFSVGGDLMNLWAYAHGKAKMKLILWGPNGWYEEIDAAASGGTQATTGAALLVKGQQPAAPVIVTP